MATPEQVITARSAPAQDAADAAHRGFLATKTFGSLDGLRALSILVVVWHHTHEAIPGWPITGRGFLGVDLFFVISGFLIVTLLLRERRRTGTTSLRAFYIRRFLRIFPPYYATLLVVGGIAFLKPGDSSAAIREDLPWAAFYLANLVPMSSLLAITWSLAVEEQFYLLVPALQKRFWRTFPALVAIAYLVVSLFPFGVAPGLPLPAFFRETTFGPILLGVLLAYLLDDPRGYRWAARVLGHPLSPLLAFALVLVACNLPGADISGGVRTLIQWTLLVLVASCVLRERHVLATPLALWPMQRIGVVSYGIYLFHMVVRHLVEKGMRVAHLESRWVLFVATAIGTWLFAEASYRWFESRFLALKSRWT